MHPRERVLETIRLHQTKDIALPVDIHAQAVRLGIIVGHPKTQQQKEELGESKDGAKSKLRDVQRTCSISLVK